MLGHQGIDTIAPIGHHERVKRVKVSRVRVVWLVTLAIGAFAVIVFVNDTSHAYNDILESMKRYAEDNPNLVVERGGAPSSALESNAAPSQIEVTRESTSILTAIAPVSD